MESSKSKLRCPNQHDTTTDDFCSVCGVQVDAPGVQDAKATSSKATPGPSSGVLRVCPACNSTHALDAGDFCEACGFNLRSGQPAPRPPVEPAVNPSDANASTLINPKQVNPQATPSAGPGSSAIWEAVLTSTADAAVAEVVFPMDADVILIGRRSTHRNIVPRIDLTEDDAVSHRHAQLIRQGAGFALVDLKSVNGTHVNESTIPPNVPIIMAPGDRITLGRHSLLTIRQRAAP